MRYLVVCCDGTWNRPQEDVATNVARIHNALADTAEDGAEQVRYYHSGVGTRGGLYDYLLGGSFGVGLSRTVLEAYHWLTTYYQHGDRIVLFGFSRGAYTVRSLAGLIASGGLLDITGLDDATIWRRLESIYQRRYRPGPRARPWWRHGLTFSFDPARTAQLPISFIGVWDTVGSLGVPSHLGWLTLLDSPRRYSFHDARLNPHVPHARQALALDENRVVFAPVPWSGPAAPGQDIKQVWFPGSHADVGGGHREKGLSDGALLWMIEQARDTVGLGFHKRAVDQIRPDPLDVLHDDNSTPFGWLWPVVDPLLQPFFVPRPRAVPLIDPQAPDPALDKSVYERRQNPPISGGKYRSTRVLAVGDSATVPVLAQQPWNQTGLYLEPGNYTFTAQGQWMDARIRSGPEGTIGLRRFRPLDPGRLGSTVLGWGEGVFRQVTRNPAARFLFTRREEDLPWMSLVGVVANDAHLVAGGSPEHERIAIGTNTRHRVSQGGYFYAFANDAWGFYRNNWGSVRLTVSRAD